MDIINYVVSALTAVFCFFMSYIALDEKMAEKIKIMKTASGDKEYKSKKLSKKVIWVLCSVILVISFIASLSVFYHNKDVINVCKMLLILVFLTGAAANDFREYRIPNFYPLVIALGAIIIHVVAVLTGQDGAVAYVSSAVYATVITTVFMVIVAFLTKHGIGAGDIKLLASMSMVGGILTMMSVLFFSVFISALSAAVLLISKKKKLSGSVPFAPCIYFGYIITLLFSIY